MTLDQLVRETWTQDQVSKYCYRSERYDEAESHVSTRTVDCGDKIVDTRREI